MKMVFKTSLLAATILASAPVLAQDNGGEEAADDSNVIIVTARKNASTLQDTPIAISAFDSEDIKEAGFDSILDIAKASPGVFIEAYNDTAARVDSVPRFRGVTVDNGNPLQRTATVFVDGVYVSGGIQGIGLSEVERVEIIKGPQSALFGRNTFAGAINYITKDPGRDFGVDVSLTAATRDEYRVAASIEGPIGDSLAFRVNGSFDSNGGHYRNAKDPSQKLGSEETWAVGATLLFEPSDDFRVKIRGTYYEDDDGPAAFTRAGGFFQHNFGGFPLPGGGTTETAFQGVLRVPSLDQVGTDTTDADFQRALAALNAGLAPGATVPDVGISYEELGGYGLKRKAYRTSLAATYNISDNLSFDLLTGYNREKFLFFGDFDATIGFGFNSSIGRDLEDFGIEARMSGSFWDDRISWTVGGNYLDINILSSGGFYDNFAGYFGGTVFPRDTWFPGVYADPAETGAQTIGVFGLVDFELTNELTLIFEGRYQVDEISENAVNAGLATPISPTKFKKFLPRVLVQYEPTDDTLLYANYSVGNLPGGFNPEVAELDAAQLAEFNAAAPGNDVSYEEEKLENFELGWKQTLFNKSLAFNLAAFYMKRSNEIFSAFETVTDTTPGAPNPIRTVSYTGNGATTNIYGLELDASWNVSDAFSVQGSLAIVDAQIQSFPVGQGAGDFTDVFGPGADVTGQRAPRFPKLTWSIGNTFTQPIKGDFLGLGDADWYIRSDLFHTGQFFDSNTNLAETPSAYDLNIRTGIKTDDVRIEFFVTNVLGEDAPISANNVADTGADVRGRLPLFSGVFDFLRESVQIGLRPRRQFGIKLDFSF
ncbi:MAG: TonB-dependent receptor [Parasphingorhabdus sp.]|uniref:TonB-dependent receptor n=1 Tax=Parasphingorhabdus sp. TaxID=2709688 RepID=UPI003297C7CE